MLMARIIKISLMATTVVLIFSPLSYASNSCKALSGALSNSLPTELVRQLQAEKQWNFAYYDSPRTQYEVDEVKSIKNFWNLLVRGARGEKISDNLFGSIGSDSVARFFPKTYRVKVGILRALHDFPSKFSGCIRQQTFLRQYNEWKANYVNMLLDILKVSGIKEYVNIIKLFHKKLKKSSLKILDLSPALRFQYRKLQTGYHRVDLTARKKDGRYLVTGVYNDAESIMAIDFARDISDTFVTFAHEIVHSADPVMLAYRKQVPHLYEKAVDAISNWIEDKAKAKIWARQILDHLLKETGLHSVDQAIMKLTHQRISKLKDRNQEISKKGVDFTPKAEEIVDLQKFLRVAIGLSLEGEFRAYSLSISAYVNLKNSKGLLAPVQWRESQVDSILRGDKVFAASLYAQLGLNPFGQIRTEYNLALKRLLRAGHLNKEAEDIVLTLERALNFIEQIYLEEIERFVSKQKENYSAKIRQYQMLDLDVKSQLPYFAQPGGLDNPDNPYMAILSARLTTAWILRFRSNVDQFAGRLTLDNETLMSLYAGIIDLHDFDEADLRLVGVKYMGSRFDLSNYHQRSQGVYEWTPDQVKIPEDLKPYFELVKWQPSAALMGRSKGSAQHGALLGQELMGNLVRLKMLKTYKWLRAMFPVYHMTLVRSLGFLSKLQEGQFSQNEISSDRAKELKAEILTILNEASGSRDMLAKMKVLLSSLGLVYHVAKNQRWSYISDSTLKQIETLGQALEVLRIYRKVSIADIQKSIDQDLETLNSSLKQPMKQCKEMGSSKYEIKGIFTGNVQMGVYGFPLTAICLNQELYLVRRPHDNVSTLPTTLVLPFAGKTLPVTNVEVGARPIVLVPYRNGQGGLR